MNAGWKTGNIQLDALMLSVFGVAIVLLLSQPVTIYAHDHHGHAAAASERGGGYVRTMASYNIPEVMLIDSDGKKNLLSDAISPGLPVMLNFIFTTCTAICPTMSASFARVEKQLDGDRKSIQLVSISVDPEQDTPAKLKEYAQKFGAGSQWRLFTGTTGNSILAQRAFGAYRGDKMNHVPLTFIRGANSNQWIRIEGLVSADDLLLEQKALDKK